MEIEVSGGQKSTSGVQWWSLGGGFGGEDHRSSKIFKIVTDM